MIVWTTRAKKDLDKIIRFNSELFGSEKAKEIAHTIQRNTDILTSPNENFTEIGAVDERFSHLKHTYRKLIVHHCKITYREGKNHIYIVRVFDTRQHPNKNK